MRSTIIGLVAGAIALILGAYPVTQYYAWQIQCSTTWACPIYEPPYKTGILLLIVGGLLVVFAFYLSKPSLQEKRKTAEPTIGFKTIQGEQVSSSIAQSHAA